MTTTPADAIRDLAMRALEDAHAEQQAARDAVTRSRAYIDKYHELNSLADRVAATTVDAGDHEAVTYVVRPV